MKAMRSLLEYSSLLGSTATSNLILEAIISHQLNLQEEVTERRRRALSSFKISKAIRKAYCKKQVQIKIRLKPSDFSSIKNFDFNLFNSSIISSFLTL